MFNYRIILDADATSVVQRVALRTDDIPLGEQTVAQVIFLLVLIPLASLSFLAGNPVGFLCI